MTLVKRGTARRLGLRAPDPLRGYLQWAGIDAHLLAPWGPGIYPISRLGTVHIGETRLG